MYLCMYVWINACMHVCSNVCMHACMYACLYITTSFLCACLLPVILFACPSLLMNFVAKLYFNKISYNNVGTNVSQKVRKIPKI